MQNVLAALENDDHDPKEVVSVDKGRPNEVIDFGGVLRPEHRRVAMMKLSGMSNFAIAHYLDITAANVQHILHRPDVNKYMMQIDATFVNDLRPVAQRVNSQLESASFRASQVIEEIMVEMHAREDVKAKNVALASARDILDRAGHSKTLKVEGTVSHGITINPEQLEHALDVIKESK